MQSPGHLLKSARQRLGMTQSQAADGIATSLYSKYENQETYANPERLPLLCQRLHIEEDVLQTAIDHYRAIDREIRLASRRQDFKTAFKLCMQAVQGELNTSVHTRYLSKARIAWSLGGGCEVMRVGDDVTF